MSLMDDFLETTSYDEVADWRKRPELGEETDEEELRSAGEASGHAFHGNQYTGAPAPPPSSVPRIDLGQIAHDGSIEAVHSKTRGQTHEEAFTRRAPGSQRFRMQAGTVHWDDTPSADDYFSVENYYTRRGVTINKQTVLGRPLDPRALGTVQDIRAAARRTSQSTLHAAADSHLAATQKAVSSVLNVAKKALDRSALRSAIEGKDRAAVLRITSKAVETLRSAAQTKLPASLRSALVAGGHVGAETLLRQRRTSPLRVSAAADPAFEFDPEDDFIQQWIEDHAGQVAEGLSQTTNDEITSALADAFDSGDFSDLEDSIIEAVGDDARGEMISRTLVMNAVNEGQRQSWRQATAEGLLTGNEQREWIANKTACTECDDMDGETADLNEPYDSGEAGPPLHPRCQCTEGLVESGTPRSASLFNVPDASKHQGLLVSLYVDIGAAEALFIPGGETADTLHITLCYCGDVSSLGDLPIAKAISDVSSLVERSSPLRGSTLGLGRFSASDSSDGKDVIIARVNIPGLLDFRQRLANVLTAAGCPPKANFVYTPHITLMYVPEDSEAPVDDVPVVPLSFPSVFISIGDESLEIPFASPPA